MYPYAFIKDVYYWKVLILDKKKKRKRLRNAFIGDTKKISAWELDNQ